MSPPQVRVRLLVFLGSGLSFCLSEFGVLPAGPLQALFTIIGAGTCGASWILARALFRDAGDHTRWPVLLLGALYIFAAGRIVADFAEPEMALLGQIGLVSGNLYAFVGTVALFLGFAEIFFRFDASLSGQERWFRFLYAGAYGALVIVTAILAQNIGSLFGAPLHNFSILILSCILGMTFAALSVWYRLSNSLVSARRAADRPPLHPRAKQAAIKVKRLLETEQVYTQPDLDVAAIAELVGEPKYRISQGITSALGFANFNQLINHYRAKLAAKLLSDPEFDALPILTIAIDCGFASMGPFNRAFKHEFGMTPSEFRKSPSDP